LIREDVAALLGRRLDRRRRSPMTQPRTISTVVAMRCTWVFLMAVPRLVILPGTLPSRIQFRANAVDFLDRRASSGRFLSSPTSIL